MISWFKCNIAICCVISAMNVWVVWFYKSHSARSYWKRDVFVDKQNLGCNLRRVIMKFVQGFDWTANKIEKELLYETKINTEIIVAYNYLKGRFCFLLAIILINTRDTFQYSISLYTLWFTYAKHRIPRIKLFINFLPLCINKCNEWRPEYFP